jgi:4-diphosphocytidyl-2-C-methyl-D-erythritol kinase
MIRTARVLAQAKVNLFLRILAREASGFHQLETLFCRLELGDDVVVHGGGHGRSLDCVGPRLPAGGLGPIESNLAWRAATAFAEAAGWPDGFAIEITKRIPVGGGLGGGSADAGAVLRCLDALAPKRLPPGRLFAIAASLGADVPVLTSDACLALAWGRGERMLALPALPPRTVALSVFDQGVMTRDAYGWLAESRGNVAVAPHAHTLADLSTWEGVARLATNDFEEPVARRRPDIARALDALRSTLRSEEMALMSGSGATCFAIVNGDRRLPAAGAASELITDRTAVRVVEVQIEG